MPQPQDNIARELRAAVLGNDHQQAERLAVAYTGALAEHWITLSADERAASSLPKQSLELLIWVRDMTLVQQAMAADQLALVERTGRRLTARAHYLECATLDAHS
jgi:hypothetical protein